MIQTMSGLRAAFVRCIDRVTSDRRYRTWFRTSPAHDGSPHIEKVGNEWRYIVAERGTELERRTTSDPEEVLYWLARDVSFDIASGYELEHRRPSEDSRRLLFAKQEELLSEMSADWGQTFAAEVRLLLQRYPFADGE
jgi:hypothetical protein